MTSTRRLSRTALTAALAAAAFTASPLAQAGSQSAAAKEPAAAGTACVAIILPTVEGVSDAIAVGQSVQALFVSYLTGPTLRSIALESRLPSQAVMEARQKDCPNVVAVTLTKTGGGGRAHPIAGSISQAASGAAGYIPYSGAAGAAAVGGAIGGTEAIAGAARYTRAKDEMQIEYHANTADGAVLVAPKSEKVKAKSDGQDLVTNLVAHAADAIATAVLK